MTLKDICNPAIEALANLRFNQQYVQEACLYLHTHALIYLSLRQRYNLPMP